MSDKEKGLYDKYIVQRTDGKPIKGGCIVLEFDDPNAWAAINQYAFTVQAAGYEKLAGNIHDKLMAVVDTNVDRIMSMSDEELIAEIKAEGRDPEEEAAKFMKIANDVIDQYKAQLALYEANK
ncbi:MULTISPECIES: hypothetical protein [unclassified Maridesulfovibrio]|uniref:hypothetical protein n=1 Tax=unclassified Maridesulfovibrio TaxID=2794999 RepID=UPI003B3F01A2